MKEITEITGSGLSILQKGIEEGKIKGKLEGKIAGGIEDILDLLEEKGFFESFKPVYIHMAGFILLKYAQKFTLVKEAMTHLKK